MMIFHGTHHTAWGTFAFAVTEAGVRELRLPGDLTPATADAEYCANETHTPSVSPAIASIVTALRRWLDTTLAGETASPSVPVEIPTIDAPGTEFQRAVWREMLAIPVGETRSYGDVAAKLGRPNGARAVGQACAKNPVPFLVPCHRIVGAHGLSGGFSAPGGLSTKTALLNWERTRATAGPTAAPPDLFAVLATA